MLLPRSFIGILLTLMTIMFGVGTGLIVKLIGDGIPLVTLLMYRFIFSVPLLVLPAVLVRGRAFLQINARRTLMVRIGFGCIAMACWFTSIRLLPLGQATALLQSSVIFITLMSPFLLKEKVGPYRWGAVIAGLSGVIIITNPFSGDVTQTALFGLGAALSGAFLAIVLRRLGKGDAPISVACWYNGSGFLALSVVVLLYPSQFHLVSHSIMLDLILLGLIGAAMQIVYTSAYRYADAVAVASMRYLQMPVSAAFGYSLFAEIMSIQEIFGALVIIASCLFIAWRELIRSREVNQPEI